MGYAQVDQAGEIMQVCQVKTRVQVLIKFLKLTKV